MSGTEDIATEVVSMSDDAYLESVYEGAFEVRFDGERLPFDVFEYAWAHDYKVVEITNSESAVTIVFSKRRIIYHM